VTTTGVPVPIASIARTRSSRHGMSTKASEAPSLELSSSLIHPAKITRSTREGRGNALEFRDVPGSPWRG